VEWKLQGLELITAVKFTEAKRSLENFLSADTRGGDEERFTRVRSKTKVWVIILSPLQKSSANSTTNFITQ
jgi:hypothetical protein